MMLATARNSATCRQIPSCRARVGRDPLPADPTQLVKRPLGLLRGLLRVLPRLPVR